MCSRDEIYKRQDKETLTIKAFKIVYHEKNPPKIS
jgi:hypothetical protein